MQKPETEHIVKGSKPLWVFVMCYKRNTVVLMTYWVFRYFMRCAILLAVV